VENVYIPYVVIFEKMNKLTIRCILEDLNTLDAHVSIFFVSVVLASAAWKVLGSVNIYYGHRTTHTSYFWNI